MVGMIRLVLFYVFLYRRFLFYFFVLGFWVGEYFCWSRLVGIVFRIYDNIKLDFKLGYLNEVCYNVLYFILNFVIFLF